MEPVNEQLIERTDAYIEELFTPPDAALSRNLSDADAAWLPPVNVSPNQGRLLYLLAKIAGAKRIVEVGTLGGYSTTWLARALPADGLLVTQLSRTGTLILADNVIRHGLVLDAHPADPNDAGAKAYNDAIARHPRLDSLILPIVRARADGMSISLVR